MEEAGLQFETYEYQTEHPDRERLEQILDEMGKQPEEIVGKRTKVYQELYSDRADAMDRDEWIEAIVEHPGMLVRPLIRFDGRAIVGRPPEDAVEQVKQAMQR